MQDNQKEEDNQMCESPKVVVVVRLDERTEVSS